VRRVEFGPPRSALTRRRDLMRIQRYEYSAITRPPVCSACQYKTTTFAITAADLSGGRLVSGIARTDVEHTGTCPYAGYNTPCVASSGFDVSCLITGPGTYSIGYSPNGPKTSGGSTLMDDDVVITIVGDTTKDTRRPLNPSNPTTIVQPTISLWWGGRDRHRRLARRPAEGRDSLAPHGLTA
jgi:hypothetical protein